MSPGFLARVARHPRRVGRDEREDRLTELLAAILDSPHCPGLARHVVLGWLSKALEDRSRAGYFDLETLRRLLADEAEDWECLVTTQRVLVVNEGLRRPDLELRFVRRDDPSAAPLHVWVEVKHGTSPHTRQLQAYLDAQRESHLSPAAVLLVAPRGALFDQTEIPERVPWLTWQDTATWIAGYPASGPVEVFLLTELQRYLREESLMDPDRITPVHLVALANYNEAWQALDVVTEWAASEVAARWSEPVGEAYKTGHEWAWNFRASRADESPARDLGAWKPGFWRFADASEYLADGRAGVPCFLAGAQATQGAVKQFDERRAAALQDSGFRLLARGSGIRSKSDWVVRTIYPEEILAGASLQAQADSLARWVVDALTALTAVLD